MNSFNWFFHLNSIWKKKESLFKKDFRSDQLRFSALWCPPGIISNIFNIDFCNMHILLRVTLLRQTILFRCIKYYWSRRHMQEKNKTEKVFSLLGCTSLTVLTKNCLKNVYRPGHVFTLHSVPESLYSFQFRFSQISAFCNKK